MTSRITKEDVRLARNVFITFIVTGVPTGLFMTSTVNVPLWVGIPIGFVTFVSLMCLFAFSIIAAGEAS